MKRRIHAEELGSSIDPVVRLGDEVLVEEDGKIIAAIIPGSQYAELERYREEATKRLDEFVGANRARNANVPAEDVRTGCT